MGIYARMKAVMAGLKNKKSVVNTENINGGKHMAVCKYYKKSECAGNKTCTNSAMTTVKFCPFVKDGCFQNKKASCTCKGYVKKADTPCGIAGVYESGHTSAGKYYVKFINISGGILGKLVDHCGRDVSSGSLIQMKANGNVLLAAHITQDKGLNLDSDRKLKVTGTF